MKPDPDPGKKDKENKKKWKGADNRQICATWANFVIIFDKSKARCAPGEKKNPKNCAIKKIDTCPLKKMNLNYCKTSFKIDFLTSSPPPWIYYFPSELLSN